MKALHFCVTVEGLPDHAKDYRVQGNVCTGATHLLETYYPDGAINVIVGLATGRELVDANERFAKRYQEARPA